MHSTFSVVFFALVVSACALWLLSTPFRMLRDPEKLLKKVSERRQDALADIFETSDPDSDQELFERLGRFKGIWRLGSDANALRSICWGMELDKVDGEEYAAMANQAFAVNLSVYIAFIEGGARAICPGFPRSYARHAAAQYVDMCLRVKTLAEVYRPEILESLSLAL